MKLFQVKYYTLGEFLGVDYIVAQDEESTEKLCQKHINFWHKIKEIQLKDLEAGILGNPADIKWKVDTRKKI